jgi:hypothetical protein
MEVPVVRFADGDAGGHDEKTDTPLARLGQRPAGTWPMTYLASEVEIGGDSQRKHGTLGRPCNKIKIFSNLCTAD